MRLTKWFARSMRAMAGQLDPLDNRYYSGASGMFSSAAGQTVSEESAQGVATVWACVDLISKAFAMLPCAVKDEGTAEPVPGHPIARMLVRNPNPYQTAVKFRRMMMRRALLSGNAYAKIVRTPSGVQLWPIDPSRVTKTELLPSGDVRYTISNPTSSPTTAFRWEDILHIYGPTMDGLSGLSVIGYARQTIGANIAMERHGALLFSQGVRPSVLLTRPANASGRQMPESLRSGIQDSFNRANAGEAGAHRGIVLEDGMVPTMFAMSNEDAQFLESQRFGVGQIARWYGVPPHMVGDVERTTSWGSGIEQMSAQFVTYCLQPWAEEWEQALEMALLRDGEQLKFNLNVLLRGDALTRYQVYQIGRNIGTLSPNDVLRLEDMPMRDDPGGDKYQDTPNGASPNGDGAAQMPQDEDETAALEARTNAAGVLVRAGYVPEDAAKVVGLPPMRHLGFAPVTVQSAPSGRPSPSAPAAPPEEPDEDDPEDDTEDAA